MTCHTVGHQCCSSACCASPVSHTSIGRSWSKGLTAVSVHQRSLRGTKHASATPQHPQALIKVPSNSQCLLILNCFPVLSCMKACVSESRAAAIALASTQTLQLQVTYCCSYTYCRSTQYLHCDNMSRLPHCMCLTESCRSDVLESASQSCKRERLRKQQQE